MQSDLVRLDDVVGLDRVRKGRPELGSKRVQWGHCPCSTDTDTRVSLRKMPLGPPLDRVHDVTIQARGLVLGSDDPRKYPVRSTTGETILGWRENTVPEVRMTVRARSAIEEYATAGLRHQNPRQSCNSLTECPSLSTSTDFRSTTTYHVGNQQSVTNSTCSAFRRLV